MPPLAAMSYILDYNFDTGTAGSMCLLLCHWHFVFQIARVAARMSLRAQTAPLTRTLFVIRVIVRVLLALVMHHLSALLVRRATRVSTWARMAVHRSVSLCVFKYTVV
jgi:hypothetical protein